MAFNLHQRCFLTLRDFSAGDIGFLLKLAADLKTAKTTGTEQPLLRGKEIALIFEKDSTRTRVGFEVAAHDQGATVTYLGPSGSHIGHKESIKDTARVLGRVYDAIEYRGFGQSVVETLATWSGVPVYNGLTDQFHPTQILADFLTMREHSEKPLREMAFCFLGDTGNNMASTLGSVLNGALSRRSRHVGELLSRVGEDAIDGARGNSGAILAQFLHGVAEHVKALPSLDPQSLAMAHVSAVLDDYHHASHPHEDA